MSVVPNRALPFSETWVLTFRADRLSGAQMWHRVIRKGVVECCYPSIPYRIETNGKRCQPLHGRLNTSPSIMYVVSYSCLIYYVQSRTRYVQYIVLAIVGISIISMIILSCYNFGFHFKCIRTRMVGSSTSYVEPTNRLW